MHCSSMKSVERTKIEADLDAFHFVVVVVVDGMKDSKLVNFRYCPVMRYEAVSSACQSWIAICCHTLGMSFQSSFVVVVFPHAIAGSWHWVSVPRDYSILHPDVLQNRIPCSFLPAT